MTEQRLLTIGHSTHSFDGFIGLLQLFGVGAIGDVRSTPWSRRNPAFNGPVLAEALKPLGIAYVPLGQELGGRSDDSSDYLEGRIDYRRLAKSPRFERGLSRIATGLSRYRLALLCAEKEPLNCHRALLIGRELDRRAIAIDHIHADGTLETNEDAMLRLLRGFDMEDLSLFQSRDELLDEACSLQARRVAFAKPTNRQSAGEAFA